MKFERIHPDGYVVWTDGGSETGRCLGKVWKNERHYNLRRVIVVKGWSARKANGPTIGSGEAYIFRTRAEAAEALRPAPTPEEESE